MPTTTETTVAERLRSGRRATFSFEFFPPKDTPGAFALGETIGRLSPLKPDWVSVTYGATGSSRERTFEAIGLIRKASGIMPMGHLTVAGQSVAALRAAIERYGELGVDHILAVRGDPAAGPTAEFMPHPEGLSNATELVRLVKSMGDFHVGVAAYPDGHGGGRDLALDARILVEKQEAGAEFAISQLFFSASRYVELVERARRAGADLPIVPGIMPVTSVGQLDRFGDLSGTPLPVSFTKPLRALADDPDTFREVALALILKLIEDLRLAGAPGLQFFTLNRSRATTEILARLRELGQRRWSPGAASVA